MNRLPDHEESANITQLTEFRMYWRQSGEYPAANYGNNHIFIPAMISYRWKNGRSRIRFLSTFRAFVGSGPDDGMIDIDETEEVAVEAFHLRFSPAFQSYRFDESDRTLVVSGSSPKMGGSYEVRIIPRISEP